MDFVAICRTKRKSVRTILREAEVRKKRERSLSEAELRGKIISCNVEWGVAGGWVKRTFP